MKWFKVYVYRHEYDRGEGRTPGAYTLAYTTNQGSGACVHNIEAADGYTAKKAAKMNHKTVCGNTLTQR